MIGSILRTLARLTATALTGAVLLAFLLLETAPRVTDMRGPDAAAAARALDLARDLRIGASEGRLRLSEAEINEALAAGTRVQRDLLGRAEVQPDGVAVELSYPLPHLPLWVNLSGLVLAGEGLAVRNVRLGHVPVPPGLAREVTRLALDRGLGPGSGDLVLGGVRRIATDPPHVLVELDLAEEDGQLLADRARRAVGAAADGNMVARHLDDLHAAGQAAGGSGSALPFIRQAVEQAARRGPDAPEAAARDEMRAALFALALYCGDERFGPVIGKAMPREFTGRDNGCRDRTLGGRLDLRKHFVVSAGLYAATSGPAAKGVGELKELLDSNPGGSGFSFDDMAANLAGTRFARELMERSVDEWPILLAALTEEAVVMPAIADLPSGLDEASFRARYGNVESPAYRRVIEDIRQRVDALPLYRPAMN